MRHRWRLVLALCAAWSGAWGEEQVDPYDQSKVPLEADSTDPSQIKIVLVAGAGSHAPGDHEHVAGVFLLSNMLRQTANVCPVIARDGWPKNAKIFEGAKTIVFFCDGRERHPLLQPGRMELLQKHIDQGAGWVNLHFAVDYPRAAGERMLAWLGGYYDEEVSVNPTWRASFKAIPEHPITRGVKPFVMNDEWYYNMRWCEGMKGVTPILKAVPPEVSRWTDDAKAHPGREEIMAWTFERPNGGRSFAITGGHTHKNFGDVNFRRLITNAILWTAKVEIPADGAKVDLDPKDLMRCLDDKGEKRAK